jgi:hypothetical protein
MVSCVRVPPLFYTGTMMKQWAKECSNSKLELLAGT